jgi:DNA repair protein RecO (recombination protein O)
MPRHIVKTKAIVLRTYKMGETSKLVTLYTADFGKIKVTAKGARKPKSKFVGALELMTMIHAVCYMRDERDLQTLSDCDLVRLFPALRHDLRRMAYGSAACELVERLTIENEPNQRLFRYLEGVLQALEEVDLDQAETLFWYFQLRLADAMGYRPELHACATCRQPLQGDWLGFSPAAGGALCAACGLLGGTRIRGLIPGFLAALQDLPTYHRQAIPLTPPFRAEIRALLVGFLAFHGGGPPQLKALEFLEALGAVPA